MEDNSIISRLNRAIENRELENCDIDGLTAELDTPDKIRECLPGMRDISLTLKGRMEKIDSYKKVWGRYADTVNRMLINAMTACRLKSVEAGSLRATVTARTTVTANEEALLRGLDSTAEYILLQSTLPPYVTLKLGIDKTRLKEYMACHPELYNGQQDLYHTDESLSLTFRDKAQKGEDR